MEERYRDISSAEEKANRRILTLLDDVEKLTEENH